MYFQKPKIQIRWIMPACIPCSRTAYSATMELIFGGLFLTSFLGWICHISVQNLIIFYGCRNNDSVFFLRESRNVSKFICPWKIWNLRWRPAYNCFHYCTRHELIESALRVHASNLTDRTLFAQKDFKKLPEGANREECICCTRTPYIEFHYGQILFKAENYWTKIVSFCSIFS